MDSQAEPGEAPLAAELVTRFLKAQNLEQLGRTDEAVALYEAAIAADFDSSGPYDRLIEIYSHRALHLEVVRVAEAALRSVRTHADKYRWYESTIGAATRAAGKVPHAAPKTPSE